VSVLCQFSGGESLLAQKTNGGNRKGLCPSMLMPILITHNNETSFKHKNQKKILKKTVPVDIHSSITD